MNLEKSSSTDDKNELIVLKMGSTTAAEEEERQQQIVPVYELLLSSDDPPSASLRVASVHDSERVNIRCAIATDSAHAFIPGTLTLHKNGKRVGTTADDGTVFTRRTVTVEKSLNYEFVPFPTHRRTISAVQSADDVIILNKSSMEQRAKQHEQWHNMPPIHQKRRRHQTKKHKTRSNTSSDFSSTDHSFIFHCSALARPGEARRRGRVPGANLYQRTLKIMPSIEANHKSSKSGIEPCPEGIASRRCLNGGACVQTAPDKHFCRCTNGFSGRNCEQFTSHGMASASSPIILCLSFLLLAFLFFAVVALGLTLFKGKKRRRTKTLKAAINRRFDDINESAEGTPFEQIYEVANTLREQSPIPALYSTMQNGQKSESKRRICSEGSGYDNLERLREEIQRQKATLEAKRRNSRREDIDTMDKSIAKAHQPKEFAAFDDDELLNGPSECTFSEGPTINGQTPIGPRSPRGEQQILRL